jgi:hypothetical protein
MKLSEETWDNIFDECDVNKIFDNFHNTYLRIFYSCFSKKRIPVKEKENTWMTRVIKVSINHKRELYLKSKCSNDHGPKYFYTVNF